MAVGNQCQDIRPQLGYGNPGYESFFKMVHNRSELNRLVKLHVVDAPITNP